MILPKSIFRSYDIRGVYPLDFNEVYAAQIGRALGTFLQNKNLKNIVLGRDDRASSPAISERFIEGLLSTGCNVTDIGITLTPIIHFLTHSNKYDAGVIVTASHNPKEFNGIRIDYAKGVPFFGDDIQALYELTQNQQYKTGHGSLTKKDESSVYINFLKKMFPLKRSLKVLVDCGSGSTSIIAPRIFNELNQQVIPVYCNYDSNFPHGVPDPENKLFMGDLSKKVLEQHADIGFVFDTDGDRFGVVDEKGTIYDNDKLLLLFAENILKKQRGTVLCDIKSSSLVIELIKTFGGFPKMIRTGHPFFMEEMKKGALVGAEYSGHTYFADKYFGFDDGVYAACRVLEILNESSESLSSLMKHFPKRYHTGEIKIACPDDKKFTVVEKIKKIAEKATDILSFSEIDGIRMQSTPTGWFLIRASNTSPYLSIRIEGGTEKELKFLQNQVVELLKAFKLSGADLKKEEIYFS
ncbi:MAG TPA: phosphomannomutase/phosphoglucomutase [Candidatus Saccharimonadales bacterium]|nr:phosphomannomutase/phosphoglucomutase [Candidatus Saccharimonadales bacterium]